MESKAVITVLGQDRPGIVAAVSAVLAESGANIEDISQTIRSELFAMIMLVTWDTDRCALDDLREALEGAGEGLGVQIQIQSEDIFRHMHRV